MHVVKRIVALLVDSFQPSHLPPAQQVRGKLRDTTGGHSVARPHRLNFHTCRSMDPLLELHSDLGHVGSVVGLGRLFQNYINSVCMCTPLHLIACYKSVLIPVPS